MFYLDLNKSEREREIGERDGEREGGEGFDEMEEQERRESQIQRNRIINEEKK
jgi:hypothetical protein